MTEDLKQKLMEFKSHRNKLMGRLLNKSYRYMSELANEYLSSLGYDGFKVGHLILLVNLDLDGTTNNELAKRANVTKQAMSKMVKELVEYGFIETAKHPKDARATIVTLTQAGGQFILDWKGCSLYIDKKIGEILGQEKLSVLKDILEELVTEVEAQGNNRPKFANDMQMVVKGNS
ncbi:DNA-binding transcriptional regulator, MarR family [Pseudarcicella hirudinis]|uniref:DNA-binding transcriptional regulator, MarR family n=2 Tax=Pseudarcicella hirudinis TaxID=1079859 RepID=A0A1I5RDG6_9BACT|nr:DNA-binding transcriptional regulator, MarR family [Pseudarcicella hirudinis]